VRAGFPLFPAVHQSGQKSLDTGICFQNYLIQNFDPLPIPSRYQHFILLKVLHSTYLVPSQPFTGKENDFQGDDCQKFVCCGNNTAIHLRDLLIPLAIWLNLFWALESPVTPVKMVKTK